MDTDLLQRFFSSLGVDYSKTECESILADMEQQTTKMVSEGGIQIDPRHRNSTAPNHPLFSPFTICKMVFDYAAEHNLDPLTHSRFKKFTEEVIPVVDFAIGFNILGYGKSYILIRENPDIGLVMWHPERPIIMGHIDVLMEVMQVPEIAFTRQGDISHRHLVDFVISKKFLKRYGERTVLLIVLDLNGLLDLEQLSEHFANANPPFFQIWLHACNGPDIAYVARVWPNPTVMQVNIATDYREFGY